jgi:Holliday junction resolvase RusA-like endonuclease
MTQSFIIDHEIPTANEYINACRVNKFNANTLKKNTQEFIMYYILKSRLRPFTKPVYITYIWHEKDKKRDLDNIAFGKKFINDALVEYGILKNDNYKYVKGFSDNFRYGDKRKVEIILTEIEK